MIGAGDDCHLRAAALLARLSDSFVESTASAMDRIADDAGEDPAVVARALEYLLVGGRGIPGPLGEALIGLSILRLGVLLGRATERRDPNPCTGNDRGVGSRA